MIIINIISVVVLAIVARGLPIGTAYAAWTGIGTAGTVVLGMILFAEPRDWPRLLCMVLIIAGVVSLKLVEKSA